MEKTKGTTSEQIGAGIGGAVAIVAFEVAAPHLFERATSGGIDIAQIACAALAGGFGAVAGRLIAKKLSPPPKMD